jgi:hypothetical protein
MQKADFDETFIINSDYLPSVSKVKFTRCFKGRKSKRMIMGIGISLFIAALIIAPAPNSGFSTGIGSQTGCSCHDVNPDSGVDVEILGIPAEYNPGEKYSLDIIVTSSIPSGKGGFDLYVDDGTFSNPGPNAQLESDTEVIHSSADSRAWSVDWTAPPAGAGTLTFTVVGNAVDGDGGTSGDGWNTATYTSSEMFAAPMEDTIMTLEVPRKVRMGDTITITATLLESDGAPLEDELIRFFRATSFGEVEIGSSKTDSNGSAVLLHSFSYSPLNSSLLIDARFEGTANHSASHLSTVVVVESEDESTAPADVGFILSVIIFIAVVLSVWSVFGYVLYQIWQIRKEGKQSVPYGQPPPKFSGGGKK